VKDFSIKYQDNRIFSKIYIIKKEINCVRRDNRMCIMVAATYIDGYAFRCSLKSCRLNASLKRGSKMASPNIEFKNP